MLTHTPLMRLGLDSGHANVDFDKPFSLQKTEYQRVASGVKDVRVSCAATGLQAFAPANLTERNASRLVVTSQTGKMELLVVRLVLHT